jgi:hypothetical protein
MLVDTDPQFIALHENVRKVVRVSEQTIADNVSSSMAEEFKSITDLLPDELRTAMARKYQTLGATLAECFCRGHFDVYRLISETIKEHEVLTTPTTRRVQ